MATKFRELLRPLNLAAVMVWTAIAFELGTGRVSPNLGLDGATVHVVSMALHVLLLIVVVLAPCATRGTRFAFGAPALAVVLIFALLIVRHDKSTPVLLIIAVAMFAQLLSLRAVIALWIVINMALYAVFAFLWRLESSLIYLLMYGSFQLFAIITAWYARSAENARDDLVQANAELLATRSLLAESARDQERLRLSRELHDVAGHKLTALKLNLAAAVRDPHSARMPEIALSAQLADELLSDIRGVVAQMRHHDGMNLRAAIEQLAAPLPRPRVHIAVDADATVTHVEQAEAIVRAVQEALTNAARHGNAENVWIVLRREGDRLQLDIRDDGRGSAPLNFGNGLNGMRERLRALDGDLSVTRNATGGVALHAWLQLA